MKYNAFQRFLATALLIFTLPTTASASIFAQIGSLGPGTPLQTEDFESLTGFSFPPSPFASPNGFTFEQSTNNLVVWNNGLGFADNSLYQNGGASDMMHISLTSGGDIGRLELAVGNGFGSLTQNVWLRTYNNGIATGFDFIFNAMTVADTLAVWTDGTAFDQIRIQAYTTPVAELETQSGAVSVDNVTLYGAVVPAPGAVTLLGLGLLGLWGARKKA